jgi:hypothetical protein
MYSARLVESYLFAPQMNSSSPCHTHADISPEQIRWHQTPLCKVPFRPAPHSLLPSSEGWLLSAQHDQLPGLSEVVASATAKVMGKKATALMFLESELNPFPHLKIVNQALPINDRWPVLKPSFVYLAGDA